MEKQAVVLLKWYFSLQYQTENRRICGLNSVCNSIKKLLLGTLVMFEEL